MTHICRQTEIGRNGFFPETMVKWEGTPIPRPYMYLRILSMVTFAEFCAPGDILDKAWDDVVACAITAGGAVDLATLIADPNKTLAAFESAFKSYLAEKLGEQAESVQVSISRRLHPQKDWHR